MSFLYVGAGGMLGSVMRYGLTLVLQRQSIVMPFGTLWSNICGCFIIGVIAEIAAQTEILSPQARLFIATGVCGGFTTFSSLIYELAQMCKDSEYLHALVYLNATFIGSALAFLVGTLAVKGLARI